MRNKNILFRALKNICFLGLISLTVCLMGATHVEDEDILQFAKVSTKENKQTSAKPVHALFYTVKTLNELQQKLQQAKAESKPAMIEFYASWCPSCQAIDAQVFSRADIQRLMRPFMNLRVDLTKKNDDAMQIVMYYQVYGTPTFIFYDKEGNEYHTDRFKNISELKAVLMKLAK